MPALERLGGSTLHEISSEWKVWCGKGEPVGPLSKLSEQVYWVKIHRKGDQGVERHGGLLKFQP